MLNDATYFDVNIVSFRPAGLHTIVFHCFPVAFVKTCSGKAFLNFV